MYSSWKLTIIAIRAIWVEAAFRERGAPQWLIPHARQALAPILCFSTILRELGVLLGLCLLPSNIVGNMGTYSRTWIDVSLSSRFSCGGSENWLPPSRECSTCIEVGGQDRRRLSDHVLSSDLENLIMVLLLQELTKYGLLATQYHPDGGKNSGEYI